MHQLSDHKIQNVLYAKSIRECQRISLQKSLYIVFRSFLTKKYPGAGSMYLMRKKVIQETEGTV